MSVRPQIWGPFPAFADSRPDHLQPQTSDLDAAPGWPLDFMATPEFLFVQANLPAGDGASPPPKGVKIFVADATLVVAPGVHLVGGQPMVRAFVMYMPLVLSLPRPGASVPPLPLPKMIPFYALEDSPIWACLRQPGTLIDHDGFRARTEAAVAPTRKRLRTAADDDVEEE